MEAIGLNPIRLDAIGIDPIRLNAIRLGVPGASSGSDRPYIAPEVLASLVAVVKCDGKSNNDPDRAIIKNLVDPDNPFVISNAAYKLNSGFGKYEADYSTWTKVTGVTSTPFGFKITEAISSNYWLVFLYNTTVPAHKVKVSGIPEGGELGYSANKFILKNGINELPEMEATSARGFTINLGTTQFSDWIGLSVEQIPSFQGALVTDGVDDLIVSQKTVQEMLGGSNEITVVSMIHHIYGTSISPSINYTNYIRKDVKLLRTAVKSIGESGIYGYTYKNSSAVVINNILGDKNDYSVNIGGIPISSESKFSVQGHINNANNPTETSQVAWYWTFIAKRALTTDEINQVIAYYNLDKYVKPDIYYDVKKQGLSNNTPDADWYLKDFSGNGRDMQLYNFAKKLDSGVGKYVEDFTQRPPWYAYQGVDVTPNRISLNSKFRPSESWIIYKAIDTPLNDFKVRISGIPDGGVLCFYLSGASNNEIKLVNGYNDIKFDIPTTLGSSGFRIFNSKYDWSKLVIEQLPDYEGALVFDAVEDYGQFVGDLGLKDYTVAVDRAYVEAKASQVPIISNATNLSDSTPFIMEYLNREFKVGPNSFGTYTTLLELNINRFISYQSTYKYGSTNITRGTSADTGSGLTIGRKIGSSVNYCNIALWSLLLFPYTLSEFLLERQLKRYKLGTLYPDMVEFRPIINVNIGKSYNVLEIKRLDTSELIYYYINGSIPNNNTGSYLPKGTNIRITVKWDNNRADVTHIKFNGKEYELTRLSNNSYYIDVNIDKSPQKIDIYADEYIRYEDIVQPYPTIFRLIDIDSNKEYTYGDKLKVGTKVKIASIKNLLPELYSPVGTGVYNGNTAVSGNIITVEKTMVFGWSRPFTYLKANEPTCIASPERLRIPNSSYKILGYIPDISGHGNHLRFNNIAFTEESGVNEDGSIHFDGVDDFITIPTLSHGAKQVLMKVNWSKFGTMLYDQRASTSYPGAILCSSNYIAYNENNVGGSTYIDGVLNNNITGSQLNNITHNITVTNEGFTEQHSKTPFIGCTVVKNGFAQMAMYSFMSFPEISTEEEIKELNDIVGIEGGYVESPDYYWDAYGKANRATQDIDYLDLNQASNANQVIIDKSKAGLAALELYHNTGNVTELINRRLNANNFAFNEESGYNGWLGVGNLTTSFDGNKVVNKYSTGGTLLKGINANSANGCGYSLAKFYHKTNHILKFKISITGLADNDELYINQYSLSTTISQQLSNGINDVTLDLSDSSDPTYSYITFRYPPLTNDVDFEFLYEYPNGLVSDGVEDYLINTVIPAFNDFTVIAKRTPLNPAVNSAFLCKGLDYYNVIAFLLEFKDNSGDYVSSFGKLASDLELPESITYMTPTNYNGKTISKGNAIDKQGLCVGMYQNINFWKGVFYKMMLYSKTIDMLSINMLKNLFAKDELIDVNNPIFKK